MSIAFAPSRLSNLEVFRDAEWRELHRLAQDTPLHGLLSDPRLAGGVGDRLRLHVGPDRGEHLPLI